MKLLLGLSLILGAGLGLQAKEVTSEIIQKGYYNYSIIFEGKGTLCRSDSDGRIGVLEKKSWLKRAYSVNTPVKSFSMEDPATYKRTYKHPKKKDPITSYVDISFDSFFPNFCVVSEERQHYFDQPKWMEGKTASGFVPEIEGSLASFFHYEKKVLGVLTVTGLKKDDLSEEADREISSKKDTATYQSLVTGTINGKSHVEEMRLLESIFKIPSDPLENEAVLEFQRVFGLYVDKLKAKGHEVVSLEVHQREHLLCEDKVEKDEDKTCEIVKSFLARPALYFVLKDGITGKTTKHEIYVTDFGNTKLNKALKLKDKTLKRNRKQIGSRAVTEMKDKDQSFLGIVELSHDSHGEDREYPFYLNKYAGFQVMQALIDFIQEELVSDYDLDA